MHLSGASNRAEVCGGSCRAGYSCDIDSYLGESICGEYGNVNGAVSIIGKPPSRPAQCGSTLHKG